MGLIYYIIDYIIKNGYIIHTRI